MKWERWNNNTMIKQKYSENRSHTKNWSKIETKLYSFIIRMFHPISNYFNYWISARNYGSFGYNFAVDSLSLPLCLSVCLSVCLSLSLSLSLSLPKAFLVYYIFVFINGLHNKIIYHISYIYIYIYWYWYRYYGNIRRCKYIIIF